MIKSLFVLNIVLLSQFVSAVPYHSGFCRYGEPCEGIVSTDIREAQKICSQEPFDRHVQSVRQEQADGSVVFIGYVCVSMPN